MYSISIRSAVLLMRSKTLGSDVLGQYSVSSSKTLGSGVLD